MKTRTSFDRAATLKRLAEVFDPQAAAVRAVSEYLAALREWRRAIAPAVPKGQPTAAGRS